MRESGVIDQGRYGPKTRRAGHLKRIERFVAFPALALTFHFSVAIVAATFALRDGGTAASGDVVLQSPFTRLTQSFECLSVFGSGRFSNSSCQAVVTGLGSVGAPLTW